MIESIILKTSCRAIHQNAPFLKERMEYLDYCIQKGVSYRGHLVRTATYLLNIIDYLPLDKLNKVTMKQIVQASKRWANRQKRYPMKQNYSTYGQGEFIRIAKDWFLRLNLMEVLPEDRYPIFNKLYKYRHIRQKHINAPLLYERVMYLEYREKYGAPFNTLIFFSSYLLVIIKYLRLNTCRSVTKAEIDAAATRWDFEQKRKGLIKSKELHFSKKSFISLSTHWLKMIDCLEISPCPPYEDMINRYVEYSNERGLQKTTVKVWTLKIRNFLSMVYKSGYHLENCTPATIEMLLTKKYQKSGYKRISIKNYATAIRNFLNYAGHAGLCCPTLSAMVESPRIYSHEGLPLSSLERYQTTAGKYPYRQSH